MIYRVFDKKKKRWLKDGFSVCLNPYGDLVLLKKIIFGLFTVQLIPSNRFIYQNAIGNSDKTGKQIYEGDICEVLGHIGVVSYLNVFSAYYLICDSESKIYSLNETICEEDLTVLGNCFDNEDLLPKTDEEGNV